jgi:lipopolysaccharide transport system permease protein
MVDLLEVWRYRELLAILAGRDLKVRYRQTVVGILWALLQPTAPMLVFVVLFHLLGRTPSTGDVPYAITLYCGLLPWLLISRTLSEAGESLVSQRSLITKVYFPRAILPAVPFLVAGVDFLVALVVLALLMLGFGVAPTWTLVTLPLFVALAFLTCFALALWLSALNALYRDLRYTTGLMVQVGFFLCPVIYETHALIPERWRLLYSLNPFVGVLEGFRWSILGRTPLPLESLALSLAVTSAVLVGGLVFFRRLERQFADRI